MAKGLRGNAGGAMQPPPEMGTIASSAMPNPGGIGGTAKPAAPISYFKNAADIPARQMGNVRPNDQAIGINRMMGAASPAPVQQQPNLRNQFALMALNASAPGHFGGLMGRHPSLRRSSGSDR